MTQLIDRIPLDEELVLEMLNAQGDLGACIGGCKFQQPLLQYADVVPVKVEAFQPLIVFRGYLRQVVVAHLLLFYPKLGTSPMLFADTCHPRK
jgi:hypothetical protein